MPELSVAGLSVVFFPVVIQSVKIALVDNSVHFSSFIWHPNFLEFASLIQRTLPLFHNDDHPFLTEPNSGTYLNSQNRNEPLLNLSFSHSRTLCYLCWYYLFQSVR